MHTLPAALPFRIGEEASQNFGIEIAFTFEIAIEAAVCETRTGHDLLKRDIFESVSIEQFSRTLNDVFSYFLAVAGGIWHQASWVVRCGKYRPGLGNPPSEILF